MRPTPCRLTITVSSPSGLRYGDGRSVAGVFPAISLHALKLTLAVRSLRGHRIGANVTLERKLSFLPIDSRVRCPRGIRHRRSAARTVLYRRPSNDSHRSHPPLVEFDTRACELLGVARSGDPSFLRLSPAGDHLRRPKPVLLGFDTVPG
jgi:hypothetical protein